MTLMKTEPVRFWILAPFLLANMTEMRHNQLLLEQEFQSEFYHQNSKTVDFWSVWFLNCFKTFQKWQKYAMLKQARKGFRPKSACQNFLGNFYDFFGNFLKRFFTDKRTDVWSRNFMIWKINFGLWAVALAG